MANYNTTRKFLFVGLGGIGQRHVRNLRALYGDEIELLAYRVRGLSQVITPEFKIEPETKLSDKYQIREFSNLDEALAEKPEAMFVCNPSSEHIRIALAGAAAGCHLFIEKPLSHTLTEVEKLIEIVEERKLVGLVGYQLRFHPGLNDLKSLLAENLIGRVISVNAEVGEYLPGFHPYEDYRSLYASKRELGGGVVLSQIHELDYLYWLFGVPQRVFALGGQFSKLALDVEDVASGLLEFEVEGQKIPGHLNQDYLQRPPSRFCKIVGDSGKMVLDFIENKLTVFGPDGEVVITKQYQFERNQMFLDELKHFVACIEGVEQPVVSLTDGLQSLRVALAMKESIATGNVITIS
ncbi:MAG TPA: Gfo/Idh/MocA family oxidoreductase [Pyrinomonadaceae bacterium]